MSGHSIEGVATAFQPERMYVFAVNLADPHFKTEVVLTYLKDARGIVDWAYYIPGVFLLKSTRDAISLGEALRKLVGDAFCLLIEARPENSNGWLPAAAWEWINKGTYRDRNQPLLTLPTKK